MFKGVKGRLNNVKKNQTICYWKASLSIIIISIFVIVIIMIIKQYHHHLLGQVFIGGAVLADVMKDKEEFWITKVSFFICICVVFVFVPCSYLYLFVSVFVPYLYLDHICICSVLTDVMKHMEKFWIAKVQTI